MKNTRVSQYEDQMTNGAILAVPLAIIAQAILASREEIRWLAYMMGSGKEPFESGAESDQDVLVQDIV
ncbi:hypothetical protein ACFLTC_00865 [Chloroflexota bacterium]